MKIQDLICEEKDQVALEELLIEGEEQLAKTPAEEPQEEEGEEEGEEIKPFENLDLREAYCFGWEKDAKKKCWYNKSLQAKAVGWKKADVPGIEQSLKRNVDACYFYLVSFYFVDLEDEMRWHAFFDNSKGLWRLEISDSTKAELDAQ